MPTLKRKRRLWDAYTFAGFRPEPMVRGVFGDPKARVIALNRRTKKQSAARAANRTRDGTTAGVAGRATFRAAIRASIWSSRYGAWHAGVAAR